MRMLLVRPPRVNQLDVLSGLIVETRRNAGKPHWQRISTACPACGRPVLWSRDWSILRRGEGGFGLYEDPGGG
jgi:hypothetical protein